MEDEKPFEYCGDWVFERIHNLADIIFENDKRENIPKIVEKEIDMFIEELNDTSLNLIIKEK